MGHFKNTIRSLDSGRIKAHNEMKIAGILEDMLRKEIILVNFIWIRMIHNCIIGYFDLNMKCSKLRKWKTKHLSLVFLTEIYKWGTDWHVFFFPQTAIGG